MENLLVKRNITRLRDGSYHVDWFPANEEIKDLAVHGADFATKEQICEYEHIAHEELVFCVNMHFDEPLYQVNANSLEHSLYIKRKEDGVQAVNALMAELRNTSLILGLPEFVNRHIENVLQPVKQDVETGWWKSALDKVLVLQPDQFLTQPLIDRISNTISSYIEENYNATFV